MARRPEVVIIGAGFGGLAAAQELESAPVDVTIVDRNNFHTFQPLLYQVATAGLNAADVAYPVRGIFQRQPNATFRRGTVTGVDWETRTIQLEDGTLAFDHLIVAAGAVTHHFGVEGAAEHAFPLYELRDAIRLRNHVLARFEAAATDPSIVEDGALTFVVVGGGPTGVEVAGALIELISIVLRRDFRSGELDVERARVVLVEMADEVLTEFHPASRRHAQEILAARGVEVCTGATVERVTATRVHLSGRDELAAHTLVWAAGVRPNPLAAAIDATTAPTGRLVVEDDLRLPDHPEAFAIGDIAAIGGPDRPLPLLAPVALQSGRHAARQVRRLLDGRPTRRFRYIDKGTMATIGRRAAVAELPLGLRLQGTPAWFAWLGLHLVFLIGFRNRISVLLNWAWNYVTWDRGPRLILELVNRSPK